MNTRAAAAVGSPRNMKAPLVSEQAAAAEPVDFPGERPGLGLRARWRPSELAGSKRDDRGAERRRVVPPPHCLRRARLHGLRRLHGPRQLGDRPRWRRLVRIYAALHHHAVEPDGDPPAGARRAARDRHRPRPRTGLPRQLFASRQPCPLRRLRARHHRLRPRRGDRHGDRAAAALRNPAHRRERSLQRSTPSCCCF